MIVPCKIVFLGDSGVGKTALIHRIVTHQYSEDLKSTVGADFQISQLFVEDALVDLQIWDTAGNERFRSLGSTFYRGANACVLVYSVTNRRSFENISYWYNEFMGQASVKSPQSFPVVVFGNKADDDDAREIGPAEAVHDEAIAHYPVFQVSARTGSNVQPGLETVCRIFLKEARNQVDITTLSPVQLTETGRSSNGCCSS
jgi:Ras-related protein Rab-7A